MFGILLRKEKKKKDRGKEKSLPRDGGEDSAVCAQKKKTRKKEKPRVRVSHLPAGICKGRGF